MSRGRVSVAGLMFAVIVAAGGFYGMRNASPNGVGIAWTLAVGWFLQGIFRARYGLQDRRDWWFGCSAAGLSYLLLGVMTQRLDWPIYGLNKRVLDSIMPAYESTLMQLSNPYTREILRMTPRNNATYYLWLQNASVILIVVQSYFAGCLGGLFATWVANRQERLRHAPLP